MAKYYDHEPAYRAIAERGGTGWDDCPSLPPSNESYLALDRFLASALAPNAGDVLDLGCGGGQASIRLARDGLRVTGVDFSPTAIDLARRNAAAAGIDATFAVADCTDLADLATASFDLAIDNHVLHCLHGVDRAQMLCSVARVLRPGGLLWCETMSREGDFVPHLVACDPVTFLSARGTRYWVSERELDDELTAAGFDILERTTRSVAEPGIGDSLVRVARRVS